MGASLAETPADRRLGLWRLSDLQAGQIRAEVAYQEVPEQSWSWSESSSRPGLRPLEIPVDLSSLQAFAVPRNVSVSTHGLRGFSLWLSQDLLPYLTLQHRAIARGWTPEAEPAFRAGCRRRSADPSDRGVTWAPEIGPSNVTSCCQEGEQALQWASGAQAMRFCASSGAS